MNIKKTTVMMCNRLQDNTITVDGNTIERFGEETKKLIAKILFFTLYLTFVFYFVW